MKSDLPSRFGPYDVIGPLGAGGMGEVYRARDTRLQREVAIKILPQSAATNPDRQRRFAQEAIAASALNHPNILVVYDVGVDDDVRYLVSELVEGVSLRREMDRGRLSLKRCLDIAVQIADGLAAAHEAGIVHRDLKPDNVMITREGRVKILDFGLAKTTEGEGDDLAPSAMTQTAAGLLVGTIPYMSPEQARGARVDFRSDQFSLGLVLYEMVTGVHPCLRETPVQTLSAIIADEPRPLAELNPACPIPLRWTIDRLLAKDPHHRYASTMDLAADLRTIRDRLGEATTVVTATPARGRVWLRWSVVAAAIAGAFVAGLSLPSTPRDDVTQYKFTPFATDAGYQGAAAWSPDGKTLAYVAEADGVLQLFTKARGSSMRVQITRQTSDCRDPFWAPDGNSIYYHALAGPLESLWRVGVAGGQPEMLIEGAARATVSPDGQTIAIMRDTTGSGVGLTIWFASPPNAEPKAYLESKYTPFGDAVLHYSPDGSKLLFWLMRGTGVGPASVIGETGFWMMSPAGSDLRLVLPALAGSRAPALFSWLPDSRRIVLVRNDGVTPGSHLWLADTVSNTVRPLTITNGTEGYPAVTPDGNQVAFTSEATDFDLVTLPVDGSPPQSLLSSTRNELDPAWSPVAAEYAFVTDRTGAPEIWLRSAEGNFDRRLVSDGDFEGSRTIAFGSLAFSPDGKRIAYQRFASDGGYRIWVSPTAGGTPVSLSIENGYQDAPTWSPDGNWIAFNLGTPYVSLVKVRVGDRSATPTVVIDHVVPFSRAQWSHDGSSILTQTQDGLTLVSPDGKTTRTISSEEFIALAWSADGAKVYGLQRTDDFHHFMLVSIDVKSGQRRVVHANLGVIPQANQPIRGLSRVGTTGFATSIARVRSDVFLLEGFSRPQSFLGRLWRP